MSRRDPGDTSTGQLPVEPGRCDCGHPEPVHTITRDGNRGTCSCSTCACRRYTPET